MLYTKSVNNRSKLDWISSEVLGSPISKIVMGPSTTLDGSKQYY